MKTVIDVQLAVLFICTFPVFDEVEYVQRKLSLCVSLYNFNDFHCILHFCLLAMLDIHLISHLIVLRHHHPCPTSSSFPFCKPL